MDKNKLILIFAILLLFAVNYSFLDSAVANFLDESGYVAVERVIDGDTFVTGNESVRLLGINTPEKGEFYYEEAKEFLESLVLKKEVKLEYVGERQDKYYRTLAYVFVNGENVNLELVRNGFANYYFYSGKDKYSDELLEAWKKCLEDNVNLCEKSESECAECISVNDDSLINSCGFDCDIGGWEIKGEGREKFVFEGILNSGEIAEFELDLSDSGGSLFLRDAEGKLVLCLL